MESKVCSRSHGQPPGARKRAMISTSFWNFSPALESFSMGGSGFFQGNTLVGGAWVRVGVRHKSGETHILNKTARSATHRTLELTEFEPCGGPLFPYSASRQKFGSAIGSTFMSRTPQQDSSPRRLVS